MKIAIVGTGYVGLVTGTCFAEIGVNVICVDTNSEKIEALKQGIIPIYENGLEEMVNRNAKAGRLQFTTSLESCLNEVDVIFSAVGTPPDEDGSADLSYVLEVARTIGRNMTKYVLVVTKSTVPVGTAGKVRMAIQDELDKRGVQIDFDVASNPEFLKEGNAVADFMSPDRVVVSGVRTCKETDEQTLQTVSAEQLPRYLHGYSVCRNDQIRSQLHACHPHQLHERHCQPVRAGGSRRQYGTQRHRFRYAYRP